jgi:hypothetical protein
LPLLQGLPTGPALVHRSHADTVGAQDFCALAARAGALFLYFVAESFDAHSFDLDEESAASLDPDDRAQLTALRERAAAEQGRCCEVRLRFVAGGVVHAWEADAAWYNELSDGFAALVTQQGDPVTTPEEVNRIAGILQALPDFREATSLIQRERIMLREHPQLRSVHDNGLSRLGFDALREATEVVSDASKQVYTDFAKRVPELAGEILQAGALDESTSAAARRAAVREFLKGRSGGYPPPKELVEIVYGHPLLKKPRTPPRPGMWSGQ